MDYIVEYSDRKTVGIYIKDSKIIVRAPKRVAKKLIDDFVSRNEEWIKKHLEHSRKKVDLYGSISEEDKRKYKMHAKEYFKRKTEYYANIMGIKYSRITITSAKKRFGSCSSEGNISYSYMLYLYPERAREYVIVHELAHRVHMNHSREFYALIEKFMPDYKARRKLLKTLPTK